MRSSTSFLNDSAYLNANSTYTPTTNTRQTRSSRGPLLTPYGQPPRDEFAATFEQHHELAETERRRRAQRTRQSPDEFNHQTTLQNGVGLENRRLTHQPLVSPSSSPGAVSDVSAWNRDSFSRHDHGHHSTTLNGPPPTASLSTLLANTTKDTTSGYSRATPSKLFDMANGSYDTNLPLSSTTSTSLLQPQLSPIIGYTQFASTMGAQEQFQFRYWIKDVQQWRSIAAAVWFGVLTLILLQTFAFTIPNELSSLNPLDWLSTLFYSSPLISQPLVVIWLIALQVGLLMVRANQVTTDPTPLFQPFMTRVWTVIRDLSQLTVLGLAIVTIGLSGWCAMEVLFVDSPIWKIAPTPILSEPLGFIISGFLLYTFLQATLLVVQRQSILTFPVVKHLSRSRMFFQTLPSLFLNALGFSLKFTLIYSFLVWAVLGSMITSFMQACQDQLNGQLDADSSLIRQVPIVPSRLPSFANWYHLFLLLTFMKLLNNLSTRLLNIFLTQSIDFRQYFLHGLYTAVDTDNETSSSAAVVVHAHPIKPVQDDRSGRVTPSTFNHLTQHLTLQWLVELVSDPTQATRRNQYLFQEDMNSLLRAQPSIEVNGQNSPVHRSTLPHQPAFVPVLVYALAQVRSLTESLIAQRILVSTHHLEEFDAHPPHILTQATGNALAGGLGTSGKISVLSNEAFFATQLDGAGFFFPNRSQQTANLFSNSNQVNLCVALISFLAQHAFMVSNGTTVTNDLDPSFRHSSPYGVIATQLTTDWIDTIVEHLIGLSLAIEQYVHASHFISPRQEKLLQGHQITRSVCLHVSTTLDQSLYRLVRTYYSYLPELHLAPAYAARLQTYATFNK